MGPVRLGVGTEWLLDGRTFRVVRQLAPDRFIAQDVKFLVEQEFSRTRFLLTTRKADCGLPAEDSSRSPRPAKPAPGRSRT